MTPCHILLTRTEALDLLQAVDLTIDELQARPVLTLLLLDLVVAGERLTGPLFPDLPEAPS